MPLGVGASSKPFTVSDLRELAQDVCSGPESSSWTRFQGSEEAMDELDGRPEYCLDLSFEYSLLSLGYELSSDRRLRTGKKIGGVELGW